jgi:phage protein
MEQLKVSIKPKQEPTEGQCLRSSGYSVKINDWELGRGVTDFKLEMSADKKPKAIVTFTPDVIDVDEVMAVKEVQMKDNLVGKFLEISGEIAGRIELENEKDLLVRRAIVIDGRIGLCEQAVYIDKKVLDNYWVKIVELSTVPETINSVDSTDLVRKWLNM